MERERERGREGGREGEREREREREHNIWKFGKESSNSKLSRPSIVFLTIEDKNQF